MLGDEEIEPLPLAQPEDDLNNFRQAWQLELEEKKAPVYDTVAVERVPNKDQTNYEQAKDLFMKGVWTEKNGLAFEAMEYYRRATKIVPDIDLLMTSVFRQKQMMKEVDRMGADNSRSDGADAIQDLCHHFSELDTSSKLCEPEPEKPQRTVHISSLPREMISLIFRYVVSSDLDIRSLEQLSVVCRRFYILARDEALWRDISYKIWEIATEFESPYKSWRHMCIERAHLHFNGVYMSRVEFMRQGEPTLERFFPLWQKVTYYRYFRFFPDGLMFMHTSPSDPASLVGQLRSPQAKLEGMCRGMYRVEGDQVSCIMKRVPGPETLHSRFIRKNKGTAKAEPVTTFDALLQLKHHGKRANSVIDWLQYSISIFDPLTNSESASSFDLNKQDFPECHFARVKSYTADCRGPL